MELRYKREAAVGAMIIVATAVFVYLMTWLRGKEFRSGQVVRATFSDVMGLKEGDPVRSSGVKVGTVKRVVLDPPGQVSVYLDLRPEQGAPEPHPDARAVVRALDFFGARYVDYAPGTAAGRLDPLHPIRGSREQDIAEMAQGFSGQGRDLMANATELLAPGTTNELRAVLIQARRTLEQLGNAGDRPSRELTQALQTLTRVFQRLDLLLANNADPATQTMAHMRDATRDLAMVTRTLTRTSATLDSLVTRVNSGRGVMGQLFNDTTLIADLRRTNSALADLLTDIKANPGRYIRLRL